MRYVLVDSANMFFRARHVAFRAASAEEKVGYALHITLAAINKVANKFHLGNASLLLTMCCLCMKVTDQTEGGSSSYEKDRAL